MTKPQKYPLCVSNPCQKYIVMGIVMGKLAGGMVLLVTFHSLVLAFCHMVHLCCG